MTDAMAPTEQAAPTERLLFEVTMTRTKVVTKTYEVFAGNATEAQTIARTLAEKDYWHGIAQFNVDQVVQSQGGNHARRFNIGINIFNHEGEWASPGDENLRLWFADHANSPFNCCSRTPEQEALRKLMKQVFPDVLKPHYVLTHGSEAELAPGFEFTTESLRAAAEKLKPLVIKALTDMGCFYDPTLKHRYQRN